MTGRVDKKKMELKVGTQIYRSKQSIIIDCDKSHDRENTGPYVNTKERHTT